MHVCEARLEPAAGLINVPASASASVGPQGPSEIQRISEPMNSAYETGFSGRGITPLLFLQSEAVNRAIKCSKDDLISCR